MHRVQRCGASMSVCLSVGYNRASVTTVTLQKGGDDRGAVVHFYSILTAHLLSHFVMK